MNRVRREALEKLTGERAEHFAPDCGSEAEAPEAFLPAGELPPMAVVRTAAQAQAARRHGYRVIRHPEEILELPELTQQEEGQNGLLF